MYLSALSSLHSADAKKLQGLLREYPNGDLLVACASTSDVGQYTWISRRSSGTNEGCGVVIDLNRSGADASMKGAAVFNGGGLAFSQNGQYAPQSHRNSTAPEAGRTFNDSSKRGIDVSSHSAKVFDGDRLAFARLLEGLTERERAGWSRVTFASDCRLSGADGLHDEQAWCEAAFAHDGSPAEHTAYVVHVLGSRNYFAYFNFKWDAKDSYPVKSCHDLKNWASAYVPRMYGERDVERWVFLCREDLETFGRVAGEFRRAFTLMDYSFDVFSAGGSPQLAAGGHQIPNVHQGTRGPAGGGLRAVLQSALGRLGMGTAETWTSSDQAMINRLVKVLADKPSGPIDLTMSPSALPKLKALLLKRLKLTELTQGALTRTRAIELYLDLARFYAGWDKVSCEGLFNNNETLTIDRLANCLTDDMAQDKLDRNRLQFVAELASNGVVVDAGR